MLFTKSGVMSLAPKGKPEVERKLQYFNKTWGVWLVAVVGYLCLVQGVVTNNCSQMATSKSVRFYVFFAQIEGRKQEVFSGQSLKIQSYHLEWILFHVFIEEMNKEAILAQVCNQNTREAWVGGC